MSEMPIRAAPYRHQEEAFAFVQKLFASPQGGGAALLMEMGTGKTLTSIAITGALWNAGRIQRLLIVAPLSILGVWQDEFQKFAAFDYSLAVLEGTTARKVDTIRHMNGAALQVLVVNYESAWRLEAELLKWAPDLIIADEGHKIKTHNIAASKALHRLGAKAKYRLLLTGTVITNKPVDVFSQYKFTHPRVYGPSFYLFRNRYFDMVGYGNHTPIMKRSMEPEFTARLHSIAFRAIKAECLDLPDITDIVQRVELEPATMRTYRQLVKDSYAELAGDTVTVTNVLTRLLRLSQLTGGFLGGDDSSATEQVSSTKLDALADIIESAEQDGKKLVVIARFIPEIRAIGKLLTKKGIRYAQISGEIKDRDAQVASFQNDPGVTVFIGQIATAGLGITLTAASTMVFFSMDYSMSNYEQTRARIHRVGQRQPCTYIHLVAQSTVDERVLRALRDKADLARALVDDCRAGRNPFDAGKETTMMLERATAQTLLAGKREDDPMIVRPQGSNWKEKPMQDRLFELADTLKALRERKDALEAELKQVNMDIDDADFHLADLMAETETQNFTRAGTLFCLTTKTRASAQAGRRAELYAALRDKGYGDLVYETVNANSLSAFVKEQMEEQDALPDWLDGLVHVFEKTTVSVRKAR